MITKFHRTYLVIFSHSREGRTPSYVHIFANSRDPDEVADNELPKLDLHCLNPQCDISWMKHFFLIFRHKFCCLLFWPSKG